MKHKLPMTKTWISAIMKHYATSLTDKEKELMYNSLIDLIDLSHYELSQISMLKSSEIKQLLEIN